MMATFPVKYSEGKMVFQLDLRVRTTGKGTSVRKNKCRIGTWNVRSLRVSERLENAKTEMERLGIDIWESVKSGAREQENSGAMDIE
jgi:hypothetical protein